MRRSVGVTTPRVTDRDIEAAISKALDRRQRGKSLCPSEVARALSDDWRSLMCDIRRVAQDMSDRGLLRTAQKGRTVNAQAARGPIRLARPEAQDSD